MPLVIIKCQLYLVSVHSRRRAPCNAMLHVLYFVFQIPRSDLEFQVMNSGCAACTINVVHFTILLFFLSELQLKEQANLYENRSLSTVKLTKAIISKDSFSPLPCFCSWSLGMNFLLGLS